jgi:hypothetical protein
MSKVILAGREYEIQPLPLRQARKFRERIAAEFDPIMRAMDLAPTVEKIEISNIGSVYSMVDGIRGVLFASTDHVFDILCEYCLTIQEDRERLEDQSFDAEIMVAFVEVLKQLYPFGSLRGLVNG